MVKFGYSRQLALGSVASAGTFAVMIPPSILMVIYGLMTNLSIGKLLMAGLLPGLFTIVVYLVSIYIRCKWISPSIAPASNLTFTWREKFLSTRKVLPIIIIFAVVLGGIYAGWFTPTAGAAVGAITTFIVAFAMKKLLKKKEIAEVATTSALGITQVMMILVGGFLFSIFLTRSGFVDTLSGWVLSFDFSAFAIIVVICLMYLVLGCFMDAIPMMLITVSFVFPIITKMGFDGIWFGVILVKLCEIGAITPPIGINLFVVAASVGDKQALGDVIKGVVPFIGLEMIVLIILILVPQISLIIPQHMSY
jgi:C4-dicarboxylate transporter DctM subunit